MRGRQDTVDSDIHDSAAKSNLPDSNGSNVQADGNYNRWRYDNREPSLRGSWTEASRIPAIARIEFGSTTSITSEPLIDRPSDTMEEVAATTSRGIPRITLRSSVGPGTSDRTGVKCFHVMYDETDISSGSSNDSLSNFTAGKIGRAHV